MILILCTCLKASVSGFVSQAAYTFTAMITFLSDSVAPQITHTGLERISPITRSALIEVAVSDDIGIGAAEINYYTDASIAISTITFDVGDAPVKYNFSYKLDAITEGSEYFYYRIKTTDKNGNSSSWPGLGNSFHEVKIDLQETAVMNANGGSFSLADGNPRDGQTSIEIPQGALDKETNISITEINPLNDSVNTYNYVKPLAVFKFEPDGLVFNKPVKMNLLYQDTNNDGIADGTQNKEDTLKIMWWDGFEWRYVGGTVDKNMNTVSARINHFSIYGIFPVPSLTDNDYRPKERIITPASADNINDYATFGGIEEGDIIKIFDVTGRLIRKLNDTIIWDGRDDSGEMVESGLYIYQIKSKATGKFVHGTIVIAK